MNDHAKTKKQLIEEVRELRSGLARDKEGKRTYLLENDCYRTLFESAGDAIFIMKDDIFIDCNQKTLEMFGCTREQIIGQPPYKFSPPTQPDGRESKEKALEKINRALSGKPQYFEWSHIKYDGSPFYCEVSLNRVILDKGTHIQAIVRDISERKEAEVALQESEERFHKIFLNGTVGIALADEKSKFIDVNPKFCEMIGFSRNELLGQSFIDITFPDDREESIRTFQKSIQDKTAFFKLEKRFVKKDGSILLGNVTVSSIDVVEGKPHYFLWVIEDITGYKKIEKALRESEEKYRKVVENANEAIAVAQDGKLKFFNEKLLEITGYTREEVLKMSFLQLIHPEDRKMVLENHQRRMQGKILDNVYSFRIIRKTGDSRWMEINAVVFNWEGRPATLNFLSDITDRKKTEEKLVESRKMLRLVLDTIPVRVFWKDCDSVFLGCNELFARDAGLSSPDEIVGKTDFQLAWKNQAELYRRDDRVVIKSGISKLNYEEPQEGPNGIRLVLRTSKTPLYNSKGKIIGILGTYEDISEQKKLQEQFRQAQKMEAIGRLAGGVAHDFNNLLTAIKGYSDLLLADASLQNSALADVKEISKAANRAASLTNQLLAFSRKQMLQPKIIDLHETIHNVEKMLRRLLGEDILLIVRLQAKRSQIKVDPNQMEQAVMNLAVNARDAMPDGGKLIIETQNIVLDESYSYLADDFIPGDYIQLSITDFGIGMNDEIKQHLFEPFFTTKGVGKGTGLGLPSVYGMVKQSDGYIWVYSEQGEGTTFKIYLPLSSYNVKKAGSARKQNEKYRGSETILLVEDEEIVRNFASRVLYKYNYTVLDFKSAEDALKAFKDKKNKIDLLITDVIMPNMVGPELSAKLKQIKPDLKVLYISGYTNNGILQRKKEFSEKQFLQKPFAPAALLEKIRSILDDGKS